jgi:hypothetical protein
MLCRYLDKENEEDIQENFPLETVLNAMGLSAAIRVFRGVAALYRGPARFFSCQCARELLPLYEEAFPEDRELRRALNTAESFALGGASADELKAAHDKARALLKARCNHPAAGQAALAVVDAAQPDAREFVGYSYDCAQFVAWESIADRLWRGRDWIGVVSRKLEEEYRRYCRLENQFRKLCRLEEEYGIALGVK